MPVLNFFKSALTVTTLLWLGLGSFPLTAHAEKNPPSPSIYDLTLKELMELRVVTAASGFEQTLKRAGANAIVISREEWQAMGANTLSDVLKSVAGVHVTKPTLSMNHNLITIRGLGYPNSQQIKILIDGRPVEYVKDSGIYLGFHMPLNLFKRIEVVKGPGSAVYGADAFAGVINLVSFAGEEMPSNLMVSRGSFDTQAVSLSSGFNLSDNKVNLAVDYLKSDGDNGRFVNTDLQTTLDQIFNTQASNAPGVIDEHFEVLSAIAQWQWQNWQFNAHSWHNVDFGTGAGIAQALDPQGGGYASNDGFTLIYDLSKYFKLGDLDLSFNYVRGKTFTYLNIFPADSTLPVGSDGNINFTAPVGLTHFTDGVIGTPASTSEMRNIKLTHLFDVDKHKLRWQIGYEQLKFRSAERKNFGPGILDGSQSVVDGTLTDVTGTEYVYVPNLKKHFYFVSLQDEWDFNEQLLLTLGARWDKYSDFGSTFNPRVSLSYQFSPSLNLKLFAGSAFRAPSIDEQYVKNNPVSLGNPNLGPEQVKTLEGGANLTFLLDDNLTLDLSVYDYDADDMVILVFDPESNRSIAQNVGKQSGQGGEISLRWKPQTSMTLNLSYSYLSATNGSGYVVPDIPEDMVYLDMHYKATAHWQWSFNAKWIHNRARSHVDTRAKIGDYLLVNSRLAYADILPNTTLSLSAKNLFNRDARAPSNGSIPEDYPLPGRQWLLELSYGF